VELGRLMTMMKASEEGTLSAFLCNSFSRVSPSVAKKICDTAKVSTRSTLAKIGRDQADALFHAIQETKIANPSTDCIAPIGEQLILRGLYQVVPGEFYASATRPPNVYRGNPFQIEVGIAYGGEAPVQRVTLEMLTQLLSESDARTLRQFLMHTFNGLGSDGAERIMKEAGFGPRSSPSKLEPAEIKKLLEAMRSVNVSEGQSMQVLRYANRVPLQFKPMDCAITQSIMNTNWRSYGLSQSRNSLPQGPVCVMVHIASVWVPYTSESKEAVASYPEIEKELRLALQSVGRKLGMYLRRRLKVKQQGERRNIFLRYLGEVAEAVSDINNEDKSQLYDQLVALAKKHTSEADMKLDKHGRPIIDDEEEAELAGDNVLIVDSSHIDEQLMQIVRRSAASKPKIEAPVADNGDEEDEDE
jgi:DNA topoisomerase-6 subunit B